MNILDHIESLFRNDYLIDKAIADPEWWALVDKIVTLKYLITSDKVRQQKRALMGEERFREYWNSIKDLIIWEDTRPLKEKIHEFKNCLKFYEFRYARKYR